MIYVQRQRLVPKVLCPLCSMAESEGVEVEVLTDLQLLFVCCNHDLALTLAKT